MDNIQCNNGAVNVMSLVDKINEIVNEFQRGEIYHYGSTIFFGTADYPSVTDPKVSDIYINRSNGKIFQFIKNAYGAPEWELSTNLMLDDDFTPEAILQKLTTIDGRDSNLDADKLDGYESDNFLKNDNTSNGAFQTSGSLIAGRNTGEVALTTNDGFGNSNITFNHTNGIPDHDGSSGRISCNVDNNTAHMVFGLKNNVLKGAVGTQLANVFKLSETNCKFLDDEVLREKYFMQKYSGAVGRISSPLFDLPLKNSLVMKYGVGSVSFSRATTATYVDRYGSLRTADKNIPRFEKEGYLNEGASTNFIPNSVNGGNTHLVTIDRSTAGTTSPDGTNNAIKITGDGTPGFHFIYQDANITLDTEKYTASVFVKKLDSDFVKISLDLIGGNALGEFVIFQFSTEEISNQNAIVKKLSNGWYRISITAENNGSNNIARILVLIPNDSGDTTTTKSVYMFGQQIEEKPFATSYIPTNGSQKTRAQDILNIDCINNVTSNTDSVTYSVEASRLGDNMDRQVIFEKSDALYNLCRFDGGHRIMMFSNRSAAISNSATIPNKMYRIACFYNVSDQIESYLYVDGEHIGHKTADNYNNVDATCSLKIGHGTGIHLYGHIRNFRIYDAILAPEEISLL